MHLGHKILLCQPTALIQFPAQGFNVLLLHGEASRHGMPAEFGKEPRHLHHSLIHMIPFYRASGALDALLAPGQEKHGMIVFFLHSSRNDSRQALMYLRQENNQYLILLQVIVLQVSDCLLYAIQGHVFSAVIQFLQFRSRRHGFHLCPALQKLQSPHRGIQPPRGIEAGSQNKAQMIGTDFGRIQPVHLHQRL